MATLRTILVWLAARLRAFAQAMRAPTARQRFLTAAQTLEQRAGRSGQPVMSAAEEDAWLHRPIDIVI